MLQLVLLKFHIFFYFELTPTHIKHLILYVNLHTFTQFEYTKSVILHKEWSWILRHCDSDAVTGKFVNTKAVTVNCCKDKRNAYGSGSNNSHCTNPAFKWLRFYFMALILELNPIIMRPKTPFKNITNVGEVRYLLFSQNMLYLKISPQFQTTAAVWDLCSSGTVGNVYWYLRTFKDNLSVPSSVVGTENSGKWILVIKLPDVRIKEVAQALLCTYIDKHLHGHISIIHNVNSSKICIKFL
jgi:hypothetical protein